MVPNVACHIFTMHFESPCKERTAFFKGQNVLSQGILYMAVPLYSSSVYNINYTLYIYIIYVNMTVCVYLVIFPMIVLVLYTLTLLSVYNY